MRFAKPVLELGYTLFSLRDLLFYFLRVLVGAGAVRAVLLELLPGNTATIKNAATRLGLSQRSLQRRLAEKAVNFRELVNSTLERLARHYLSTTTMSGGEIAFLLGFADPNSFYRAFKDRTNDRVGSSESSP